MDSTTDTNAARWAGHPVMARVVRFAIVVVPFAVAMAVAFVLSARLPIAEALPSKIGRWVGIVAVATLAMMVVDRLARRLLPLSALLKLTLVFPDQAPSRFRVAMRTGTTVQLKKRLAEAREVPLGETSQQAAERLLELVGLLSHHDRLTRGHSERVRAYTHLLGEELGLTGSELDKLRWAGLLHDVGKIAIDTDILNKPGELNEAEYETIKTHPDEGRALVGPLADWLGESIRAVWEHHEHFDGGGYPRGLAGLDISFAARVVTVADSYDVMTSARSYKKPMAAQAARAELAAHSGTQFVPVVVRAFLNLSLGRLRLMNGPIAWFAQLALFEPTGVVHATGTALNTGSSGGAAGTTIASSTSTVVAATASTASAGVTSTVAATAVSVAASTAGIVAAAPPPLVAEPPAPVVASVEGNATPLGDPAESFIVVDIVDAAPAGQETVPPASDVTETSKSGSDSSGSFSDEVIVASTASPDHESDTPRPESGSEQSAADVTANPNADGVPNANANANPNANADGAPNANPNANADGVPNANANPNATIPSSTTSTTTTTAPSTATLPPLGDGTKLYLGGAVLTDSAALPFHVITSSTPADVALANLDTDRDNAPGVLLRAGPDGIDSTDPAEVLAFKGAVATPIEIDGDVRVSVAFASADFERNDIDLQVGVYACSELAGCDLLGSDSWESKNVSTYRKANFIVRDVDAELVSGMWLEVRFAVLDTSDNDAWVAFGVKEYDSFIALPDGD